MKKMGSRDFQREMPEIFRSFKQIRAWRTARGEREAVQLRGEAEERIEEESSLLDHFSVMPPALESFGQ